MRGVAPYVKLLTAESLKFPDGTPVTSPAAYIGWHRLNLAAAGAVALEWMYDGPRDARVNHGRWITDCPNCRAGALTHPDWRLACCGECGCVMRHVVFPAAVLSITDALLRRSTRDVQNWFPHETMWDLQRENIAHEVA